MVNTKITFCLFISQQKELIKTIIRLRFICFVFFSTEKKKNNYSKKNKKNKKIDKKSQWEKIEQYKVGNIHKIILKKFVQFL